MPIQSCEKCHHLELARGKLRKPSLGFQRLLKDGNEIQTASAKIELAKTLTYMTVPDREVTEVPHCSTTHPKSARTLSNTVVASSQKLESAVPGNIRHCRQTTVPPPPHVHKSQMAELGNGKWGVGWLRLKLRNCDISSRQSSRAPYLLDTYITHIYI